MFVLGFRYTLHIWLKFDFNVLYTVLFASCNRADRDEQKAGIRNLFSPQETCSQVGEMMNHTATVLSFPLYRTDRPFRQTCGCMVACSLGFIPVISIIS